MSTAAALSEKLDSLTKEMNNVKARAISVDALEMSTLAHDILNQLKNVRREAGQLGYTPEHTRSGQLLADFYSFYTSYLQVPANAERVSSQMSRIFKEYGEIVRSVDTNLGHVHIVEKYDQLKGQRMRYAIKISKLNYTTSRVLDDPATEARWYHIVSKDGNPTMMPIYESYALGDKYVSITPAATMGDLFAYLTNPAADKSKLKDMYTDLLYGMSYLHNHLRVAHMDLKPENVFITDNHQIILGDLGVALPVSNEEYRAAEAHMFQLLESEIASYRAQGATNADVEKHKQRAITNFETSYRTYQNTSQAIANILRCFSREQNELVQGLGYLEVPLSIFFMEPYVRTGFSYDTVLCINGYSDPTYPHISGAPLIESFLTQLRRTYPDNPAAQKAALRQHTVRLKANLPARLYATTVQDSTFIRPARLNGARGTRAYMCPMLMLEGHSNPFAADVYSLGVILFICATGFPPYKDNTDRAFLELQKGGVAHLLKLYGRLDSVDASCVDLLEKMMDFDPEKRPTVAQSIELFYRVTMRPFN